MSSPEANNDNNNKIETCFAFKKKSKYTVDENNISMFGSF